MPSVRAATGAQTLRTTASPWTLLRAATGGRREIAGKLARLRRTLRLYANRSEVDRRLAALRARGLVAGRPTRAQIFFGGLDMLRFMISPAAADYYRECGISFGFHQLLRFCDDPVSIIDPTGILSDRDTIVGHVMQVVHFNPVYDLQLLQMFDDGLEDLERQVAEMVDGVHPRSATIAAIVEEPGYHARLLDYVRRFRDDPATAPLRREQAQPAAPEFEAVERTFATLPRFIEYCARLPARPGALALRLLRQRRFPVELAAAA